MLILSRKPGETIYIGDNVAITICDVKNKQVKVGISAPREIHILREELTKHKEPDQKSRLSNMEHRVFETGEA